MKEPREQKENGWHSLMTIYFAQKGGWKLRRRYLMATLALVAFLALVLFLIVTGVTAIYFVLR